MNRKFVRWALGVGAVAAAAFVFVGSQFEEPLPPRVRPSVEGAVQPAPASAAAPAASASAEPLSARVLFGFDRATLDSTQSAKLMQLVARLKGLAFERLDAIGHADRIGPAAYNLALSQRRADAVKAYLVSQGIDAAAVRTEAKGESQPVSGDGCLDLGPETRSNRALVECLEPDRRAAIEVLIGRADEARTRAGSRAR